MNVFDLDLELTRTQHDGTVEALVSFQEEPPTWIPMRTLESMCNFINKKLNENLS